LIQTPLGLVLRGKWMMVWCRQWLSLFLSIQVEHGDQRTQPEDRIMGERITLLYAKLLEKCLEFRSLLYKDAKEREKREIEEMMLHLTFLYRTGDIINCRDGKRYGMRLSYCLKHKKSPLGLLI
jgi:hypothetical protein